MPVVPSEKMYFRLPNQRELRKIMKLAQKIERKRKRYEGVSTRPPWFMEFLRGGTRSPQES